MAEIPDFVNIPPEYIYQFKDGVHSLLEPQIKTKLSAFLKQHLEMQRLENYSYLTSEEMLQFPFIDHRAYKNEVFTRRQDLQIIEFLLKDYFASGKTLLEIGGWNSWLTNRMQLKGIQVLSADIFDDDRNGLRSRQYYHHPGWLSLQTDILNTSIYKASFDVIIFNHCLQFLSHPLELVTEYRKLLKPAGIMVLIGMNFSGNGRLRKKNIENYRQQYLQKYDLDIQFYPSKGYFDLNDLNAFKTQGFIFNSYRFSAMARLKRWFKGDQSGILYFRKVFA
jgi:2-polyprenyl-3-methyl-5-hydroxy-6-metoxy-1,4-benzoquinol methylase